MKAKLVYVLASNVSDLFYEQCLISVMSARHYNPTINIVLVVDNFTKETLTGKRKEILEIVNELVVVDFPIDYNNLLRSRLMKVTLRNLIKGDYLYIDCDTLVVDDLSLIDKEESSLSGVLDSHTTLPNHPIYSLFEKQSKLIDLDIQNIRNYFSGGVIYSKDNLDSYKFYSKWEQYYKISNTNGLFMDEPSLNRSNYEMGNIINEISGIWNCQVRYGALFLANAKILHFCSKKNMPVAKIATKEFLANVKDYGIRTPGLVDMIINWKTKIAFNMVVSTHVDYEFITSSEYEEARKRYIQSSLTSQINHARHLSLLYKLDNNNIKIVSPATLFKGVRNQLLGYFFPKVLSSVLFYEKFHKQMNWERPKDLNEKITWLAFNSETSIWTKLADKYEMRGYVESLGCGANLPKLYGTWDDAEDIDFSSLPQKFVIKCNHDNGSSLIIKDQYSIDHQIIKVFLNKCLKHKFGIVTAEPHYKQIRPKIIAEELIENDHEYSDSIVNFKFFSFNGFAPYCQVIYNLKNYGAHISEIYQTRPWKKCSDKVCSKYKSSSEVIPPFHLKDMLNLVSKLGKNIPFCRIDLYETRDRAYISEFTFMPGCGRINNFSQSFLDELGDLTKI